MTARGPFELSAGAVFHDRYRIVRPLKAGGMGAVYEAFDQRTQAVVALKLMLPEAARRAEQRARFEREAQIAAKVDSEHVVRVVDSGVDGSTPFIAMELLRGEGLDELLERCPVLTPRETLSFVAEVAAALSKTHAVNIVHRDLKPENLFVARRDDGTTCLKVLDFGVAKVVADAGTQPATTKVLGTPVYMAPEQVRGDGTIGPAADLYSMAHLAYALLVGEPYWEDEAVSHDSVMPLFMKILGGAKERASERARRRKGIELPAGFDAWFEKATELDPALRFVSAEQELDALRPILSSTRHDFVSGPTWAASGDVMPTPREPPPFFEEPTSLAASASPQHTLLSAQAQPSGPTLTRPGARSPTNAFAPQPTLPTLQAPYASPTLQSASSAPVATWVQYEPPRPPAPFAPQVRRSTAWVWPLLGGVAIAGVAIAWAVFVTISGAAPSPSKRASRPSSGLHSAQTETNDAPSNGCFGALCVPFSGDPQHASVDDLIRGAIDAAHQYDDGAKLAMVSIVAIDSPRIEAKKFAAMFVSTGRIVMVTVPNGQFTVSVPPGVSAMPAALTMPQCPFDKAWDRATRQLTGQTTFSVTLQMFLPVPAGGDNPPRWSFLGSSANVMLRGDNCEPT